MMIDCHAHLADVSFDLDRGQVRDRAAEAGVHAVLIVGEVGLDYWWTKDPARRKAQNALLEEVDETTSHNAVELFPPLAD